MTEEERGPNPRDFVQGVDDAVQILWQGRVGLGNSPRVIVDEFRQIQSADVVRRQAGGRAPLGLRICAAIERVAAPEKKRGRMPARIPVGQLTKDVVVKLRVERKHIADLLKMVASQAEGDRVRLVTPHYRRAEDEGRTLIQSALASAGDIAPDGDELRVALEPLSSPHRTHALAALCDTLNETRTRFPGSKLRLRFEVKPPRRPASPSPDPAPTEPRSGLNRTIAERGRSGGLESGHRASPVVHL
ncbi:MAG: hypothetical protein HY812_03650 [Planctomycetes bacterium]|nr:hypothetical protein [Planctomycetota bacterium]